MRLREVWIDVERNPGLGLSANAESLHVLRPGKTQVHVRARHGQPGTGEGVASVTPERRLKCVDGPERSRRRVLDERRAALQVRFVRRRILCVSAAESLLFRRDDL